MAAPLGPLAVELGALQSPNSRGRGIARYALNWARALESLRPDLVGIYLLDPELAPPGECEELLATGKVVYRGAALPESIRGVHLLAPLDPEIALSEIALEHLTRHDRFLSATVYDCIPALDPENELADPSRRRPYSTRLEILRAANQIHVLSASVKQDLSHLLGIASERIVHVGAAPDASFRPPPSRIEGRIAARTALGEFGVDRPFVFYPSGSHPRKNNERLLRAWSLLPEPLRETYQLVIASELPAPTIHHYRVEADRLGFSTGLVVTGYLGEAALLAAYQGADLVCVPSLAEGFGLPIAEALACGTPVIASNRPPFDELLEPASRFDPTDEEAIAAAIDTALAASDPRHSSTEAEPRREIATWHDVAQRSAEAFDLLLQQPTVRPLHTSRVTNRRPRIALVTPLPPAPTGTARYGYRLAEELARSEEVIVDLFVDGERGATIAPAGLRRFGVHALEEIERWQGRYDEVLYTIGNSHHHLGALAVLRRRQGLVLAHDVRLTNLYRHEHGDPGLLPGGLARAIADIYDHQLPSSLGRTGDLDEHDYELYAPMMARQVIQASKAFLVTSQSTAALARTRRRVRPRIPVAVIPFALERPIDDGLEFLERGSDEVPDARSGPGPGTANPVPVVGHFGIVDEAKRPELLLEAAALLSAGPERPIVAFVGPISEALREHLLGLAQDLGMADLVHFTGACPTREYRGWLDRATIAVQLRKSFYGEASAAVGECLASGLATVVSELGWFRELPNDVVRKVPVNCGVEALTQVIGDLLSDGAGREQLGAAAVAYAGGHGFSAVARALLEFVGRDTPAGPPTRSLAGTPAG